MAKRSPFPGMDPYIEASGYWRDFHTSLSVGIKEAIARQLPKGYHCVVEERTYLVTVGEDEKEIATGVPDVAVLRPRSSRRPGHGRAAPATAGAILMEPVIPETYRQRFIEIRGGADKHLVTCIEVISPANKHAGEEGRDLYLRKRQSMLLGDVHFIEIDLLLGGTRMPMAGAWPDSPYYTLLCRKPGTRCLVTPAGYRSPLPPLTVPLAGRDPDITVPLQPLVDRIYKGTGYRDLLNYSARLPLGEDEAGWVTGRLARTVKG